MDIKNIIILIISLLNIILGFVVLAKNHKNPSNIWFFLLCLFGGGWGITIFFQYIITDQVLHDLVIVKLIYIFGILAPLAFLFLAINFPYKLKQYSNNLFWFYLPPTVLILLIIAGILRMQEDVIIVGKLYESVVLRDSLIFVTYYFVYVVLGFFILLRKFLAAEIFYRKQIKYLMIATIGTFITAGIVCVVLTLFNIFAYDWLGPIFLLINFSAVGYLIFIQPKIEHI
jgi:hypothetical protein